MPATSMSDPKLPTSGDHSQSVNAGFKPGEFITKPFVFAGEHLELNYSTAGAGEIRVEIQNADGSPITGVSLDDCQPLKGDAIGGDVLWKETESLSHLAGKPIRLRFLMREADIYSLKFR